MKDVAWWESVKGIYDWCHNIDVQENLVWPKAIPTLLAELLDFRILSFSILSNSLEFSLILNSLILNSLNSQFSQFSILSLLQLGSNAEYQ